MPNPEWLRVVASGAFVSVWLVGCGTIASIPREIGRPPTAEEQKSIDTFVPRVIATARHEGFECAEVPVAMSDMANDALRTIARPSRNPCAFYVQVNPRAFQHDSPMELAGTLAHELAHVINRDWTPERAAVPQIERERQADAVAIRILKRMGTAECLAQVQLFQKIRAQNIRAWGTEQRETVTTHPSYTERIRTFEVGCRP
jgi:hypothetical protein